MATISNACATVYNTELALEKITTDAGFTFIDFLPRLIQATGFLRPPIFENYRTLVDRANEFLRNNRKWKVVTCESVEFKSKNDEPEYFKMTYVHYGELHTSYVRGLRLWLTERKDEKEREQQIGYINMIPKQLEKRGLFKVPKFETLDTVIERFNSMLHSNPLPGRIITIESQEIKINSMQDFDPDRSNWDESGDGFKYFLFVLRIFYEIETGQSEEIGIKDFIPKVEFKRGIFSLPQYERFSKVMEEASNWWSEQQDFRFCNAQTLEIKVEGVKEVNTQRMDYSVSGSLASYYVRILRIAYTKPFANPYSISEKPLPIRDLTCRSFPPMQLTTGFSVPEYENLVVTKERVSAWIKATGARVLSAQTTPYRIRTGGERQQGIEASFTYSQSESDEYWMFVIRLYLDGIYKEPPPEMLPSPPILVEKNCCHIS